LSDLRQTRRRYEELVELSPSGMAYLDDRGVIRIVNAAMEQITGRPKESLVGRRFDQLDAVPEWQATGVARTFEAGMHNGSASAMRVSVQRPDGAVRTVDAEVRRVDDPSGLLATMVDVTEREAARAARGQLEQERGQAQRLEALGRLAGGVAHDFNNLLTVVTTAAHLASTHDALPEDVRLDLDDILAASTKAAELTRQLLAFGRQQALEKRVVDGSQLLGGLSRMIGRLIGEEIEIEVRSSAAACPVLIDPGQLEQVLVNLAVNARDAMRDGGRLTMSVRRSHDVPAPGQWVEFRVQDTGHGMDAETRAKIFEPFFTTKERGRGTGLGLAMVHGIVQQLDGQICVESAPGEGTTISVFLPVHQGQWEDPDSISEVTPVEACRKLNILLVEDEDAVRAVLRRGLERTGHRLMTARGVDEGVGAWLRSREVDLLITDVFLGDGLGPELVSRLKASGYTGPVLYLTGYAGRSLEDIDLGMAEVLRKPVRPGLLRARVARIAEILRSR
jgi:PAS domain S-box-containing protein